MSHQDGKSSLFISYLMDEFCSDNTQEKPFLELLERLMHYPLIGEHEMTHYMLARDFLTIRESHFFQHKSEIISLLGELYQLHPNTVDKVLKRFSNETD